VRLCTRARHVQNRGTSRSGTDHACT